MPVAWSSSKMIPDLDPDLDSIVYTGMDKTRLGHQLWEFICEDVCPRHVERNYVPLFGVDTDLRYYVIRDVIVI